MVIYNGAIYTMDVQKPIVEAVAVTDGKIVYAGSFKKVRRMIGKETVLTDLQGKTMTPGFIESHGHIFSLGKAKMRHDLAGIKNYQELVNIVENAVSKAAPGEWILGRGWHQSKWDEPPGLMVRGFQTHHALTAVSPDNPVFLKHASGHAGFANAKAMEIAGVDSETVFTDDGEIIKDDNKEPTGIFNEAAQKLITKHIPEQPSKEVLRKQLSLALQECVSNGITTFDDAGATGEQIQMYQEFLAQGKLKVRIRAMLDGKDKLLLKQWYDRGPKVNFDNPFLTIRSIKLISDGALGSRGAWLLEPYTDRQNHYGNNLIRMDKVYEVATDALRYGFQLCVHAIGDRANREVLDQYEKALKENSHIAKDHRFRIEHAQHLSAQDIPRFSKLGVIASMQGIHMSSDRPWAIERLGKQRIVEGAYVWQKLLQSATVIINGTDAPVEPINPVACFYALVTRQTLKADPPDGYEADQKMSREQALRSYTLDAAYGGFEENIKGSISVGKLADFTVFSQDIMKVPDDKLLDTTIEYTIINGKIVYKAG
ncbi:MAG: amidohydrolase [Desulfobacteraceae bacterium]|nr:amidohydrolase [Desulfobacteraceae bacterium]